MFNSDQVTEATIDRITRHYGLLAAQVDSPEFRRAVTLLVRVANGESVATSDQEIATLIDATTHVLNVLFCTPFSKRRLPIPDTFWHEPDSIGPVLYQVRVWLKRTLVNYTDAAALLSNDASGNQAAAVASIRRKVAQGTLMGFVDPFEPNPQHARRVRQSAVEAYRHQHTIRQDVVA